MNADEVIKRIAEIERAKGDDERAHSLEDQLHQDVLKAIGDGHPNPAQLANEALRTKNIVFERWYA